MAKMDKYSRQEVIDNEWLKQEVSLHIYKTKEWKYIFSLRWPVYISTNDHEKLITVDENLQTEHTGHYQFM